MSFTKIAVFSLGIFVASLAFAGVSVYGLDQYEPRWGRGISFQVLSWIVTLEAIIGALGFALGTRIFHSSGAAWRVFLVGIAVASALLLLGLLGEMLISSTGVRQILGVSLTFGVSLSAAALFRSSDRND